MDAFESLISMLLRHDGFWTTPSVKVELTKKEKQQIGRASSPRWELDLVAFKGQRNEVLAVECKSFLDSTGVVFRNGKFDNPERYKLFTDPNLRKVVLKRLKHQLVSQGSCAPSPKINLALAIGKLAKKSDAAGLNAHFETNGWKLFDPDWVHQRLLKASKSGYENDVAFVVSKILLRSPSSND